MGQNQACNQPEGCAGNIARHSHFLSSKGLTTLHTDFLSLDLNLTAKLDNHVFCMVTGDFLFNNDRLTLSLQGRKNQGRLDLSGSHWQLIMDRI